MSSAAILAPRTMNQAQQNGYLDALAVADGIVFDPNAWKPFI